MRVYLICGKAGSGKTEVAKILNSKIPKSIVSNLSKYIKLFAMEMTDWDGSEENKPRTFLQQMGDRLRAVDENFLTRRMDDDIEVYNDSYDTLIISDVRLVNEIEYFKNRYETYVIYVKSEDSRRVLSSDEKSHLTETELDNYDKFDYIIENKFNYELEKEIDRILESGK